MCEILTSTGEDKTCFTYDLFLFGISVFVSVFVCLLVCLSTVVDTYMFVGVV